MLVMTRMAKTQPYNPPLWSTGSDSAIKTAIEKHYAGEIDLSEIWSVGDERVVNISAIDAYNEGMNDTHAAQSITLVLTDKGGKILTSTGEECLFQVDQKKSLLENGKMNDTDTNIGGWRDCARRTWCNENFYNAIPNTLRPIFKEFVNESGQGGMTTSGTYTTEDYFALRSEIEIYGSRTYSVSGEGSQVEWYETALNRDGSIIGLNFLRSTASGSASEAIDYPNRLYVINDTYSPWMYVNNQARGIRVFGCI